MQSAEGMPPEQLVGKRIAFAVGEDHDNCWHTRVGVTGGTVLKPAATLTQKAEMIAAESELPADWFERYEDVPKVWVKTDPCDAFPRGCEVVVELECLLLPIAAEPK